MNVSQSSYDAYLLRIWQEPAKECAPPICYFLLEQLFDTRQRWLFTDMAELQTHLQNMVTPPTITQSVVHSNPSAQDSSDTDLSTNKEAT